MKQKTHLPVIADPSHGTGLRELVEPVAMAAVMAGADGIMVEIHNNPQFAVSDGRQSLNYNLADALFQKIRQIVDFKRTI